MKGVVFNVVEEVVVDRFGDATWDRLLLEAGVDGAYTALGNYGDDEMAAIVTAAAALLDTDAAQVLRLVGQLGFARLASRYPDFESMHDSSRSVLAALNDVIHPQVRNLYPGAKVPAFALDDQGSTVMLTYESARGLCHLAEGLAGGAVAHFSEMASVDQPECRHLGDERCRIRVVYTGG